jgi:hypothetical protein
MTERGAAPPRWARVDDCALGSGAIACDRHREINPKTRRVRCRIVVVRGTIRDIRYM